MIEQTEQMEQYMRRCINLARRAKGLTYPNPMVGCVIVHDGKIIGEGYHISAGLPHAEVNAINSVKNHILLKESTLYVNLEPCAHYGRTAPCSLLIIEKQIPKVVIGCIDTFSKVAGKGIDIMKSQGIEVITGICEEESRYLNRRFFTFHEMLRPHIILKWAESADGLMDAVRSPEQKPIWLTNTQSRMRVHKQRTEEMAILIGTRTALLDNPSLTVRYWHGNQPLRVVIDKNLSLPNHLNIFTDGNPTLVINNHKTESEGLVMFVKIDFDAHIEENILEVLYHHDVQSVIIEGGSHTLKSFIGKGLWDEAFVYRGASHLIEGVKAPHFPFVPKQTIRLGKVELRAYGRDKKESV